MDFWFFYFIISAVIVLIIFSLDGSGDEASASKASRELKSGKPDWRKVRRIADEEIND